ncbi:MAG: TetR family transcriptional regulator [Acidimicrobiia bacterium]|nr:TetR family transcriptional regulator [Acidimicrobiia bacterium]
MNVTTQPKRLSQAERRAQTRERLLEAAAEVLAERGYLGTSVDAIAEKAGYTKGAFYANFAHKEELLMALVERQCDQQLAAVEELFAEPGSLEERLRRASELIMAEGEEQRRRHLLYFELWIQAMRDPELRRRYADFNEEIRTRVADLLEEEAAHQGLRLPAPSRQLASAVLGAGDGLILQQLVDPAPVGVDAFATILKLLFQSAKAST